MSVPGFPGSRRAPHFTAIGISNLELFGGALLALGLGSRLIGLVLTGNMFMAYVTADRQALLSVFSDPGKFYNADPFTFLLASLLVLVFGPGFFSVDRILQAIRDSKQPAYDGETARQRAIAIASSIHESADRCSVLKLAATYCVR